MKLWIVCVFIVALGVNDAILYFALEKIVNDAVPSCEDPPYYGEELTKIQKDLDEIKPKLGIYDWN